MMLRDARVPVWRGALLAALGALAMHVLPVGAATDSREPSFSHGVGAAIGGLVFEAPKTLLEIAVPIPPFVTIGLVAGLMRGAQVAFQGLQEMNEAFDPWGAKDHPPMEDLSPMGRDAGTPANATSYATPGAQPDAY